MKPDGLEKCYCGKTHKTESDMKKCVNGIVEDASKMTDELEKKKWRIHISEWGDLFAIGTEKQAEEWRRHKCQWEGCIGNKRLATEEEIKTKEFKSLSRLLGE